MRSPFIAVSLLCALSVSRALAQEATAPDTASEASAASEPEKPRHRRHSHRSKSIEESAADEGAALGRKPERASDANGTRLQERSSEEAASGTRERASDEETGLRARGSASEEETGARTRERAPEEPTSGRKHARAAADEPRGRLRARGAASEDGSSGPMHGHERAGADEPSASARGRSPHPTRKKSAYDVLKEGWHQPAPEHMCAEFRKAAVPDLVFIIQGKNTTYVLRPKNRQGGFDEAQLAIAKQAFESWETGPTPHPRVLDLVYAATLHFGAPYVTLISGVRRDRSGSRHSHGLAADVVLPGVEDEELAAFFRAQGFVGVGTYPRSGFVHVDTRDQSYFWIDYSAPGRRGKITQVRADEAKLVDQAALVRGSTGFVNPPRLQKALNARAVRRRVYRRREATQASSAAASSAPNTEP